MSYLKFKIKHSKLINQPIGIATYKLTESLPNDLKGFLPTAQEISERLENLLESEKQNG